MALRDSRKWPSLVVVEPRAEPELDADHVVEDDPSHPQLAEMFDSRTEAIAHADALNAKHGNQPFRATLGQGAEAKSYLVVADVSPTRRGRWAVMLEICAQSCADPSDVAGQAASEHPAAGQSR